MLLPISWMSWRFRHLNMWTSTVCWRRKHYEWMLSHTSKQFYWSEWSVLLHQALFFALNGRALRGRVRAGGSDRCILLNAYFCRMLRPPSLPVDIMQACMGLHGATWDMHVSMTQAAVRKCLSCPVAHKHTVRVWTYKLPHGAPWIVRRHLLLSIIHLLLQQQGAVSSKAHSDSVILFASIAMGQDEAFGLLWCVAAVTIIHTLEDWRVIELWPLMEFRQLWICELTFTFA